MIRIVYFLALFGTVVSCLIFPNSLKITSAASLVVAFLSAVPKVRHDSSLRMLLVWWIVSSLVTLFYALVGVVNGAPTDAAIQVFLIYVVFPFVWIYVVKLLLQEVSLDVVVKGLIVVGVLACLTVFFFYYSFLTYGRDAVAFFIKIPNVDVSTEGYIGGTMHVFGSLIFIIGGYIASYSSLAGRRKNALLLSLFVFVALISGRGALLLAVLIGFFLNAVAVVMKLSSARSSAIIRGALLFAISCALVLVVLDYADLSLEQITTPLLEKLVSVGGVGRNEQFFALMDAVAMHGGLGSGHGIGVDYTVDDTYPWRYEMVWVASVFRVGIIGAIIYAMPFLLAIGLGLHRFFKRGLDGNEMFVLGGFICAFIASNTNPYIEALVFQWMFILPVLYFVRASSLATKVQTPPHGSASR